MKLYTQASAGLLAVVVLIGTPGPVFAQASDDVTFTRDVMPILQESCQSCHREGGESPRCR